MKNINYVFLCILLAAFSVFLYNSLLSRSKSDTEQLSEGNAKGTYRFTSKGTVKFAGDPEVTTIILKHESSQEPIVHVVIDKNYFYSIDVDLPPGKYRLHSKLKGGFGHPQYWNAPGSRFEIKNDGIIKIWPREIYHKFKMELIEPANLVIIKFKKPTLKWKGVEGAKYYKVTWLEEKIYPNGNPEIDFDVIRKKSIKTNNTSYSISEPLIPNRRYEWHVIAYDEDGGEFAYFASGYFWTDKTLSTLQRNGPFSFANVQPSAVAVPGMIRRHR